MCIQRLHEFVSSKSVRFFYLIVTVDDHLSEGGRWQHLRGHRLILFNGQVIFVDLMSYNG